MNSETACRILLIEDNPADARLIRAMLEYQPAYEGPPAGKSFVLETEENLTAGTQRLGREPFDLIILDLSLPESEGIETLQRVRSSAPELPVVVLTGFGDVALAVKALQSGAQDYLVKGSVDGNLLFRSIRYALDRHRMQREAERQAESLRQHMQLLQEGFRRMADGDLSVRLAGRVPQEENHLELSHVLSSFDMTIERLQHLSELKSQFYSMVTHDLRSPISTILLTSRTITNMPCSEQERAEMGAIIERKANYLLGLVDSLLEVFFVQSGQLKLTRQKVDANELAQRCSEELKRQAETKNQRLVVDQMQGDPEIWCDQNKMFRVLENLVSNAMKYSSADDVIRIRVSAVGKDSVMFDVIDKGPGLKSEDLERIFEPFYRSAAHSGRAKGSGLGLTIAREFVAAHGGTISVKSALGKGSVFSVAIPRHQPESVEATSS